jgi:inhibitor of KinA
MPSSPTRSPTSNNRSRADPGATIVPLGEAGVIVRVGDSLGEVLAATRKLEAAQLPEVVEIAPAFASVGVFLREPVPWRKIEGQIREALRKPLRKHASNRSRVIEVPVCYDGEFGLDLEIVSQHCGLSPNEIARFHSTREYEVRCVGFTPGFAYLGGLPQALATPRRSSPRTKVPAGSVAIGGSQTGIYPLASPGGWNIIGRTPLRLFDPERDPAAMLRTGDRVHFLAINRADFERWEK